jgi:hypothetical protein
VVICLTSRPRCGMMMGRTDKPFPAAHRLTDVNRPSSEGRLSCVVFASVRQPTWDRPSEERRFFCYGRAMETS